MGFLRERRRERLRRQGFSESDQEAVSRNVGLFRRLSRDDRRELLGHARVLVEEKHFEGAAGLEVTEEMRVTICALAAVLLLHRRTAYFAKLVSVILYPGMYLADEPIQDPLAGIVYEGPEERLGESWRQGALVVSWEDALAQAGGTLPGRNVVLHEFVHQLDAENGSMDGVPLILPSAALRAWTAEMEREYEEFRRAVSRGWEAGLDGYGATNPAEFFAVSSEAFFELPVRLRESRPRLYGALAAYYRQDPATWPEAEPAYGTYTVTA
jgi:hypothetical protein